MYVNDSLHGHMTVNKKFKMYKIGLRFLRTWLVIYKPDQIADLLLFEDIWPMDSPEIQTYTNCHH